MRGLSVKLRVCVPIAEEEVTYVYRTPVSTCLFAFIPQLHQELKGSVIFVNNTAITIQSCGYNIWDDLDLFSSSTLLQVRHDGAGDRLVYHKLMYQYACIFILFYYTFICLFY